MEIMGEKLELLQRLVNAGDVRQKVVSQNIANVNTPGYKTRQLNFEDQLAEELSRTTMQSKAEPSTTLAPNLKTRNDGNNVDLDREVGQLNKNAMLMQTYLRMIGAEVSMMRDAMEGG